MDERRQILGDVRRGFAQGPGHLVDVHRQHLTGAPDERGAAGEHLVQHDAKRVDVGFIVDLDAAATLLGGHVARRAHHHVGRGARLRRRLLLGGRLRHLGDAEVEELGPLTPRQIRVDVGHEHDVVGLEIAVIDALFVGGGQRRGDLPGQPQHLGQRQHAFLLLALVERLAFEKLHHQVGGAIGQLPIVGDLNDSGVIDQVYRARFIEKTRRDLGLLRVLGVQDLDRHATANRLLDRLENGAHASFSELTLDAIWT